MNVEVITAAHVLVATEACQADPDDDVHCHTPECLEYSIECAGVTGGSGCQQFASCRTCTQEQRAAMEEATEEDGDPYQDAHGVRHLEFEGEYRAETGDCGAQGHDDLADVAAGLRVNGPGRYPVKVVYDPDGDLSLTLIDATGSAE
jgi:hypothetical protein